jgi:hypothetical protein
LRESVERVPIRPRYNKVRTRSANVGSAAAGWLLVALEPACFPIGNEDISVLPAIAGLISIFESTFVSDFGVRAVAVPESGTPSHLSDYARAATYAEAIPSPTLHKSENARETILSVLASSIPVAKGHIPIRSAYQDLARHQLVPLGQSWH